MAVGKALAFTYTASKQYLAITYGPLVAKPTLVDFFHIILVNSLYLFNNFASLGAFAYPEIKLN